MKPKTIELLESYNSDIKELNISSKKIKGSLNLKKFTCLEKLDCSNNFIASIQNIPKTLIELNCNSNIIKTINNLPANLQILKCKTNKITSFKILHYRNCLNDKKIKKLEETQKNTWLPSSLIELDCSYNYQLTHIDNLQCNLKILYCCSCSLDSLNNLPDSLIELNCSNNHYIKSLNNLPDSLIKLNCRYCNIDSLDNLPCSLEILNCSHNKIKNLEYLPNNLKKLIMEYNYVTELELLPTSIIELICSGNKINKINIFPSLQKLICGPYFNNLNEIKNNFPNLTVKYLDQCSIYHFYDCI